VATYQATVLADNPIDYFRLDETSGVAADDIGSGNHDGVYGGPGAAFTLGKQPLISQGASVQFSGGNMQAAGIAVPAAPFTVECWLTIDSLPGASPYRFLCHGASGAGGWGAAVRRAAEANQWRFTAFGVLDYDFALTPTPGQAYHIVFIYRADFSVEFFLNAVSKGSVAAGSALVATVQPYTIGTRSDGVEPLAGRVDENALYNGILSGARITAHYQAGIQGIAGGRSKWRFPGRFTKYWRN